MASATITYNGLALPQQMQKISFSHNERQASFSSEFAIPPASVASSIETWRKWDKSFSIVTTGWSKTLALGSNATACRTTVEKRGTGLDSVGRQRLRFSVIIELQSAFTDGVREYSIFAETDNRDRQTVQVDAEITAEGATSAKTKFEAAIGGIETAVLALYSDTYANPNGGGNITPVYQTPPFETVKRLDRNNAVILISRRHVEILDPNNVMNGAGAESQDATILFPRWMITKTMGFRRGKSSIAVARYKISWSAMLAKSKSASATISQYEENVRSLVIKRIKDIFGESGDLVIENDMIMYSGTEKSASGNWEVSAASDIVSFKETVTASIKLLDSEKVNDGEDGTEAPFSPGARFRFRQEVTQTNRGFEPGVPPPPVVLVDGLNMGLLRASIEDKSESEVAGKTFGVSSDNETAAVTDFTRTWVSEFIGAVGAGVVGARVTVAGSESPFIKGAIRGAAGGDGDADAQGNDNQGGNGDSEGGG